MLLTSTAMNQQVAEQVDNAIETSGNVTNNLVEAGRPRADAKTEALVLEQALVRNEGRQVATVLC
jgi:hypothetical protein